MRIGDYEFTRDKYGWTMRSYYMGEDKHGNNKEHFNETYYPRLNQAIKAAADKSAGDCDTVGELMDVLDKFQDMFDGIDEVVKC